MKTRRALSLIVAIAFIIGTLFNFPFDNVAYAAGAPTINSFTAVNTVYSGETVSQWPQFNLNMDVTGATYMQFSSDGVTYSAWEAYSPTKVWDVTDPATGGNSTKDRFVTIHARFSDEAYGNAVHTSTMVYYCQDATITGTVTDKTTGDPISNATVTIIGGYAYAPGSGADPAMSTTTDASGNYSITVPAPTGGGTFYLRATAAGYTAAPELQNPDEAYRVDAAGNAGSLNFQLESAAAPDPNNGTISGTVTDSHNGLPLQGIYVALNGGAYFTTTDVNGHYSFSGLSQASYTLDAISGFMGASNGIYTPYTSGALVIDNGTPNITHNVALDPVTFTGTMTINYEASQTPGHVITYSPAADPTDVNILVFRQFQANYGNNPMEKVGIFHPDAAGNYTISFDGAYTYYVNVFRDGFHHPYYYLEGSSVKAAPQVITDDGGFQGYADVTCNISADYPNLIAQVFDEDTSTYLDGIQATLIKEGQFTYPDVTAFNFSTSTNGTVMFPNMAYNTDFNMGTRNVPGLPKGEYKVQIVPPAGYEITSVDVVKKAGPMVRETNTYTDLPVLDRSTNTVTVQNTSPTYNINIVTPFDNPLGGPTFTDQILTIKVAKVAGSISGKIYDNNTLAAIPGATVDIGGGKTTVTDAGGNYNFSGLDMGDYTIQVTKDGYTAGSSTTTLTSADRNKTVNIGLQAVAKNVIIMYRDMTETNYLNSYIRTNLSFSCGKPTNQWLFQVTGLQTINYDGAGYLSNIVVNNSGDLTVTCGDPSGSPQVHDYGTDFSSILSPMTIPSGDTLKYTVFSPTLQAYDAYTDVPVGSHTYNAPVIAGYTCTNPNAGVVTLNQGENKVIIFNYERTGVIYGYVKDSVSGNAIPGASVTLNGQTYTTDGNGYYEALNVPLNNAYQPQYSVQATKTDYYANVPIDTSLTPTTYSRQVDINLAPVTGSVDVFVNDSDTGNPIESASVQIGGLTASTDNNGHCTINNVPLGAFTAQAQKAGYSSNTANGSLTSGMPFATVFINLTPAAAPPTGSITVTHMGSDGVTLDTEVMNGLSMGSHSVNSKNFPGYTLSGAASQTVTLTVGDPNQNVTFNYTKDAPPVVIIPTPTPVKGSITVNYADDKGTVIQTETLSDKAMGEHTVNSKTIPGYVLNDTASKKVTLTNDKPNQTVTFTYKKETGVIQGNVRMSDGTAVKGAKVVAIDGNLKSYSTVSDDKGHYKLDELDFGEYVMVLKTDETFVIKMIVVK